MGAYCTIMWSICFCLPCSGNPCPLSVVRRCGRCVGTSVSCAVVASPMLFLRSFPPSIGGPPCLPRARSCVPHQTCRCVHVTSVPLPGDWGRVGLTYLLIGLGLFFSRVHASRFGRVCGLWRTAQGRAVPRCRGLPACSVVTSSLLLSSVFSSTSRGLFPSG